MESVDFQDIVDLFIGNSCTSQNSNTQASNNQLTNTQITNNKYTDTPICQYTNNEIRNTHINIGTGIDISIKELAELIKLIVGFKGVLYFNTEKPDGTPVKITDPSRIHSLGWKHKVELKEGIEKMYSWYLGH